MIRINNTVIAETYDEYGVMWADGDETWDLDEESARFIANDPKNPVRATLIVRHVFVSETEVAE